MKQEDYDFFKENGYVSLGKILSDDELHRFADLFDRNRRDYSRFWRNNGIWQTQHCEALLTAPGFDDLIRHPKALDALQGLMGGEVCFAEICLRHMGPYAGEALDSMRTWDGEVGRRWHRDGGQDLMWPEHPLRLGYVQLMVYLADVDETTHSFAISPQAFDQELLDAEAQLERGGFRELHGSAGTAVLFNVSRLHTVTVRPTPGRAQIRPDLLWPPRARIPQPPILRTRPTLERPSRPGGARFLRRAQRPDPGIFRAHRRTDGGPGERDSGYPGGYKEKREPAPKIRSPLALYRGRDEEEMRGLSVRNEYCWKKTGAVPGPKVLPQPKRDIRTIGAQRLQTRTSSITGQL